MQRCNSCKARIVWAFTKGGKNVPLNEKWIRINPEVKGPKTLVGYTRDMLFVRGVQATRADIAENRFVEIRESHFSSCPYAYLYRRSKA